ncbi:ImmA/IrrE family metallo-endopeptidase [Macrococcus armenti]|uniref:ImmA/IrrE family metallo-endopeptidase n=1 Tax=Macrococcus armenti TaxID=2875764 RepID=UPI001CD48D64|nr:ImmA/IrrE family metallo-endopeptidase [Macrococcus armenti]UBH10119.1 ImmA/IrrE family metallo-endopeptidase [Macrococcus armenti]
MNRYERLENISHDINVKKINMPYGLDGVCLDNDIFINSQLSYVKSVEVLAEEIGHYYTSHGNITDYNKIENMKQEVKARRFGIELVVTLDGIVEAFKQAIKNVHELAEYFDVSAEYINEAIEHYRMKYGDHTYHGSYLIKFIPNLRVIELQEF